MSRLKKYLVQLLVIVLCAVAFYHLYYYTCTFRYKLTAEVMTPYGLKTGSSVIEVSYSFTTPLPNPGWWQWNRVRGEAVYVDLSHGKNLFILLRSDESGRPHSRFQVPQLEGKLSDIDYSKMDGALDALWLPIKIFRLGRSPGYEREMTRRIKAQLGGPAKLVPLNNLPTVVTFGDLNEPNSVKVVLPEMLTRSLGPGYKFSRVMIELTDMKITSKIESDVPWLKRIKPKDGGIFWHRDSPLIDRLHYTSFKQPIEY